MKSMFLFLFCLLMFASSTRSNAQSSVFGGYSGTLTHDRLGKQQLAKLDFIVARQDARQMQLMAVLTLFFGTYDSQEYVSYKFNNVNYNVLSGQLTFDQPDQDATVVVSGFGGDTFEATFRSAGSGDIGKLQLRRGDVGVQPTMELLQPIWGEYRGQCGDFMSILQIQTSRSSKDSSAIGDPFGQFDVTAQLARAEPEGCLTASNACVYHVFDSGTYSFFDGKLELFGRSNQFCEVGPMGLVCNGCTLRRTSREVSTSASYFIAPKAAIWPEPPLAGGQNPAVSTPPQSLQGVYRGYLHHERRDLYQAASFNLVATHNASTNELMLSGVATLYFGDHGSPESIPYRFNPRPYALLAPQMVFERADEGLDAILQVTKLGDGHVEGVWYSSHFGRVGTFVMDKTVLPAIPAGKPLMERVTANYDSPDWVMGLNVTRESAPLNTRNPFFPLNLRGFLRMPQITANIAIAGGSYDFYTGKFSLTLEDGSLFTGYRPSRDRVYLKRPTPGPARPLLSHNPIIFRIRP